MAHLIYALKDDELVHVSEVERGLACGCRCPSCDEFLIARKGKKKDHHFAHQSGSECEYGYETSLHLMAKDILSKARKIFLPEVSAKFDEGYRWPIELDKEGYVTIERVELEKKFGNVIPDVAIYTDGKPVFVEIFVTHRIDDEKLEKLKELGIPTIEIDLSDIDHSVTEEELSEILLEKSIYKYWKYHPKVDSYLKKAYEESYVLDVWRHRGDKYGDWYVRCNKKWATVCVFSDCHNCIHCVRGSLTEVLCTHVPWSDDDEDWNDEPEEEPEPVKEPEPIWKSCIPVKEPELIKVSDRNEKLESLYAEMEAKKQSVVEKPAKKTIATEATIKIAKDILLKTDRLVVPSGEEFPIKEAKQDKEGNITLYIGPYGPPVDIRFSAEDTNGSVTILLIDLGLIKCVTRKRFAEELINGTTCKQWILEDIEEIINKEIVP